MKRFFYSLNVGRGSGTIAKNSFNRTCIAVMKYE
jgi:hypothetical protein